MLHFTLEPAACRVLGLWCFVPGALLSPFVFWQSFVWGAVFFVAWCLLSLWLIPLRGRSLEGSISMGQVRVSHGLFFKITRRIPTRCITGAQRIRTPLLRSCSCSLLVLYTSGTLLILPGLHDMDADAIVLALEEARL